MKVNSQTIHAFLESQEMKCVIFPKSEELPFDQIFLPMGIDEQGREVVLGIKFIEEDLSENHELFSLKHEVSMLSHLQFNYVLPFFVKDACIGEVSRLILLLNHSLGLPGFELSEIDHTIYFRSVLLAAEEIEEMIILTIIGNILTNVDTFSASLESVATGKLTLANVINNALSG